MSKLDHPPLDASALEKIADFFKVFTAPSRLAILQELREGPMKVNDLTEVLQTSQANVSKQLGHLYQAGILSRAKSGTEVIYEIAEPLVFDLCETVCDTLNRRAEKSIVRGVSGGRS